MRLSKSLVLFLLIIVGVFCSITLFSDTALSGKSDKLDGWAWGEAFIDSNSNGIQDIDLGETDDGGIGWISLNSTNCDSDDDGIFGPHNDENLHCPTSGISQRYGVTIDVNNNLVGYAWSDHYGWIRFGGLCPINSCFPSGTDTYSGEAYLNNRRTAPLDDDYIEGWARACSVFETGCSGTLASQMARGGWDGWISLKGASNNYDRYGIEYDVPSKSFKGFTWGASSPVIGWISFDWAKIATTTPAASTARCGTAHGQDLTEPPTSATMCAVGSASSLSTTGTTYNWGCSISSTNYVQCSANRDSGSCQTNADCDEIPNQVCNTNIRECVPRCTTNDNCPVDPNRVCHPTYFYCTTNTTPLTPGSYSLNPKIVATPNDQCTLSDWTVNGGTGQIKCKVDGGTDITYTGRNSVRILPGTHTLRCTDSVGQSAVFPNAVCRVNPNYGEF